MIIRAAKQFIKSCWITKQSNEKNNGIYFFSSFFWDISLSLVGNWSDLRKPLWLLSLSDFGKSESKNSKKAQKTKKFSSSKKIGLAYGFLFLFSFSLLLFYYFSASIRFFALLLLFCFTLLHFASPSILFSLLFSSYASASPYLSLLFLFYLGFDASSSLSFTLFSFSFDIGNFIAISLPSRLARWIRNWLRFFAYPIRSIWVCFQHLRHR